VKEGEGRKAGRKVKEGRQEGRRREGKAPSVCSLWVHKNACLPIGRYSIYNIIEDLSE
jgi:hypothetical protein